MHRLRDIIGPAPSEMNKEKLMERLTKERKRVAKALDNYTYKPQSKKKKKKTKLAKGTKELLAGLGLTEEEFLEARNEIKEDKE